MRLSRSLSIAIVAIVVAACNAAPGSPSPVATATNRPGAAPSSPAVPPPSAAVGSPAPIDTDTDPVPEPLDGGHSITCDEEETTCHVHLVKDGVQDPAGWPVRVDGPCRELVTGSDGLAYVGCSPPAGAMIHVLDLAGRPVDGWPARVPGVIASVAWNDFSIGCGVGRSAIELGSDDSVYVAISTGSAAKVHVFNPDGQPRDGWPQTIPGDEPGQDGWGGDGCRGFALSDDDGVVAWGYDDIEEAIELAARRTEFTSWSADGAIRPGWPRGSTGPASGPLLDSDGGITYVSASGKVWSHDDGGEIRTGWPYILDQPAPPLAAPDGRVAIVEEIEGAADQLVLLGRNGQPIAGGPIKLLGDIETQCLFGDTPCAGIAFPAFADDGTIYLSLHASVAGQGGALVALDPDGRIVDGWPVELAPRTHVVGLAVDDNDQLVAHGVVCSVDYCGGEGTVSTTLVFDPDGELLQTFED